MAILGNTPLERLGRAQERADDNRCLLGRTRRNRQLPRAYRGIAMKRRIHFEVGRHLIEGLKNPTVVQDKTALDVFPIRPMGIREAVAKALTSTEK